MFKLIIKIHKDKFTFRFYHNNNVVYSQILNRYDKSKIKFYDEKVKYYITENMTVN